MKTFRAYMLTEKVTASETELNKYIKNSFSNLKFTSGGRGGYQVRFGLDKDESEYDNIFSKLYLKVKPYDKQSLSGTFKTYVVAAKKDIGDIKKGTSILWVNNSPSQGNVKGTFSGKELSPDGLGLAGLTLKTSQIIEKVKRELSKKYDKKTTEQLVLLMKLSNTKSNVIDIPENLEFGEKDLRTITKDFGEILSAIWAQKAINFKNTTFPSKSNEPLLDFYGLKLNVDYPVSVKTKGKGGEVTIQNIIDTLKNKSRVKSDSIENEPAGPIFKIVRENSVKEGILKLHQYLNTPAIKSLSAVTKTPVKSLTVKFIENWVENKSNEKLVKILKPFWKLTVRTKMTDRTLKGTDKLRFILAPLGESIVHYLNENKQITDSFNSITRKVSLAQIDVMVKKNKIEFNSRRFKEAKFQFGWGGYTGANKIGFKMTKMKTVKNA